MCTERSTGARAGQDERCHHVAAAWCSAWLLAVLVPVAACGEVKLERMVDASTPVPPDDASTPVPPDAGAACVWTAFGPPIRVFGIEGDDDWLGSVSADGKALVFDRYFETTLNDIFVATRSSVDVPFGAAMPIDELNTPDVDATAALVAGGLEIYFASERMPTPFMGLWRAQRAAADGAFQAPTPVEEVNAGGDVGEPSLTPDGLVIYFDSTRSGAAGGRDIWFAERPSPDAPFSPPQPVNALNTTASERAPGISADRLEIFFASNRPGGSGQLDIWHATRASVDEPFGPPRNVVELSSAADDVYPRLSADGSILYFNHDTALSGGRDADVWEARRQCIAP